MSTDEQRARINHLSGVWADTIRDLYRRGWVTPRWVAEQAERDMREIKRVSEDIHNDLEAERERVDRIAKAAMYGAELIEQIPNFNGMKQVAAYQQFDEYWITHLRPEDLTIMRKAVGLPEPGDLPESEGEA